MEATEIATHAYEAALVDEPCKDENAKEMLKDIQIFSLVLKSAFPEYREYSIKEIAGRIQYFKGIRPDPADPDRFLDQLVDGSNPEVITPDHVKTIYDSLTVIQDMVTDILYFVFMEVNTRTPPADVLVGRDLFYIAREIARQKSEPFGMDKNYRGLKPVKSLWILPFSSSLGVLKKSFRTEYTGEKDTYIRLVMEAFEGMVDSRIVFLNKEWENSSDKTVQALGRLFDSDRKKAIRFMEKEGVKMTRMIETATEDYYATHFYTLGKKERRQVKEYLTQLAEQKRQLADKDQQLAAKDQYIRMLEEQLEKAKKQ